MFEIVNNEPQNAVIKVIGVGGGGGNAVEHMVRQDIKGVEFICANTDIQALRSLHARTLIQLGTGGLGAGANPEVGKAAALEHRDRLVEALEGADMVFVTAGMGGGTGTGAAPVIAEVAKELDILTVAVVTKPFAFELGERMKVAEAGIAELSGSVDSLITIPNEKLLDIFGSDMSVLDAFARANDVLSGAVQGIADLIIRPGKINLDFADVRTVMSEMGMAMIGSGHGRGANRAAEAAEAAIHSPLLEEVDFTGARGVLVNIAAGNDISLGEYSQVGAMVSEFASESATVVVGMVLDEDMKDELRVTVVATGLGVQQKKKDRSPTISRFTGDGAPDYSEFDRPTVTRNATAQDAGEADAGPDRELQYLDIPAFLRRQAD